MQQIVCNECGEPIDAETPAYYSGSMSRMVRTEDGALANDGPAVRLDYHLEHLPQPVESAVKGA